MIILEMCLSAAVECQKFIEGFIDSIDDQTKEDFTVISRDAMDKYGRQDASHDEDDRSSI